MRISLVALLLLALAFTASAQPGETPMPDEIPAPPDTNVGDALLDGLRDAGDAVAGAAEATGDGIADAASSVGRFVADMFQASVAATLAVGNGFAAVGTALAGGLSLAAAGIGRAASASTEAIGAVAAAAIVLIVVGIGDGITAIGRGFSALWNGYLSILEPLRPRAMSPGMFEAAAATGAAGSVAATSTGFWPTIRRFVAGGLALAGFSRIREDQLLEHPLRKRIFEAIQAEPGIHASALAREVESGWGTIVHHLQKLERASLVTTRRVNNQKCFFEQGGAVSRTDMAVASAVKGGTAAHIAAYVAAHPLSSQKEVAETLDISPALASFHVKKLVALGVLDRVRRGKAWMLTTSDSFRRVANDGQALTLPPTSVARPAVA